MPDRDPRRELASRPCDRCGVESCPLAFTGDGYVCEGCWPDTAPQGVAVLEAGPIDGLRPDPDDDDDSALPDPISLLELRIHELRCLVAGYDAERLAELPAAERRLVEETQLHLAEYDRAKRGEGSHG
jgi:hypothetical protein